VVVAFAYAVEVGLLMLGRGTFRARVGKATPG